MAQMTSNRSCPAWSQVRSALPHAWGVRGVGVGVREGNSKPVSRNGVNSSCWSRMSLAVVWDCLINFL